MSAIRLFVLGALDIEGPMHGHQLRQLAEKEHIDQWTDISVGGLYGAIKRLAAEGLIAELRVEREGAYPERQVYDITGRGREALDGLRREGLREIVLRPDPFDLAIARFDLDHADELPAVLAARLEGLRALLAESEAHTERARPYLSIGEVHVMKHKADRLRAEIAWHDELIAQLPDIITDERSRKDAR